MIVHHILVSSQLEVGSSQLWLIHLVISLKYVSLAYHGK